MHKKFAILFLGLIFDFLPMTAGMEESASSFGVPAQAPPAAIAEIIPISPGSSYVWIPGRWAWRGTWAWEKGYWSIRPHSEAIWVPGHWSARHRGWVWIPGHWS